MIKDLMPGRAERVLLHLPCALLLLFCGTGSGWAQADLSKLSLEELMKIQVSGASKYSQLASEAPASITIVTAEEIARFGYRTFADVLNSVRGFAVNYDRNYSYAAVRGFGRPGDYNTRILLLIDGHRLNDNIYDGAYIGTEFSLDLDLIDRIEIIRGPGSSMYGTNAFFASINVITRRGSQLEGVEIAAQGGSLQTIGGRASYGQRFRNGSQMLVSGSIYHSDGNRRLYYPELDTPANNNGIAENMDEDDAKNLFTDFSFRNFRLQASLVSRTKLIPTGAYETVFTDPRTYTRDIRGYFDLSHSHKFSNGAVLATRLGFDRYQYDAIYVIPSGAVAGGAEANFDISYGTWWSIDTNLTKSFFERHKGTLGFEYRHDPVKVQRNWDASQFYMDARDNTRNWAVYAQDEIHIRSNLILNMGARYDHYSHHGGTFNPRLALIYRMREGTVWKALYGHAFRAPNFYEQFYETGIRSAANPNLKPESTRTGELSLEHHLHSNLRLFFAGYIYRVRALISQSSDSLGQISFINAQGAHGKGVDFELETRTKSGLLGRIGYTLQRATDHPTHDVLSNSPTHLGKAQLSVPVGRHGLFASIEALYTGRRRTIQGSDLGGHLVLNANLYQRQLWNRMDLSFGVSNLLNKRYFNTAAEEHAQAGIQQDGRTFRLKLVYRFPIADAKQP